MTDVDLEQGGCKWLTTYEHAFQTGTRRVAASAEITCCNCKLRVPYTEAYVTVPYGKHGNRLPLPVFVHCYSCSLILDPQQAYQLAWAKDQAAGLPDPVRVEREAELNRLLSETIIEE